MMNGSYRTRARAVIAALLILAAGCGRDDSPTEPTGPDIGAEWRLVESGISNTVRALASNDTMTVAVGDGGIIYTSIDGLEWQVQREFGPNDGLRDIVWTGDQFVAAGYNGTILTSPDGIVWTWNGPDQTSFSCIAASDTLLVAAGGKIYSSTDGINWDLRRDEGPSQVQAILHTDSLWLACGSEGTILRSTDGIVWVEQTTSFASEVVFTALAAADSGYYALALYPSFSQPERCRLYHSTNGATWFFQASLDAWYIWHLAWTGTELLAAGEGTNYQAGLPDGLLFSSEDGIDWLSHTTEAPFALTDIALVGDQLLVSGSGGYILGGSSSADLAVCTSGADLTGAIWDGDRFVAVTACGTVMFSSDGDLWSEHHGRVSTGFERLAYSGSRYVTLGGLGAPFDIYSSPDGLTWTRSLAYGEVLLSDLTWGGGNFVVCGREGTVYLSPDGETWSREFVGDSVALNSVCWDGSRYLAAASDIVYTSGDGINWSAPAVDPTDPEPIIKRLIWTGQQYVTVGNRYDNPIEPQGFVYTSTDAVLWTPHELGPVDRLYDIAWTGSRLVVCGRSGALLGSTDGSNWQPPAGGTERTLTEIAVGYQEAIVVGGNRTVLLSP